MEEQYQSSEELQHVILNNISDAVFITNNEGLFTYICPTIENFCGFSMAEIQAFGNISKLLKGDYISFDELEKVKELHNIECQMINKSGQILSLLVNVKQLSIQEKTILYSCRDITQHKLAKYNFRQLLENTPDAMVIVNKEGMIVFVNTQTEKLFGFSRADLLHQHIEILIPERYRNQHRHHWYNYFNNLHTRAMGSGMELYASCQDGSEFPVEISLSPIKTQEGLLVLSTIRDITERKEAEKTLRNIVEGVSATTGTNFLQTLVKHLANLLQVKYAFIGRLLPSAPKKIKILFMAVDNQLIDDVIEYDLRNTPCEDINDSNKVSCCSYSEGVQQHFTNPFLVDMGIESWIGTPLFDVHGSVTGLFVIMDTKPLLNQKRLESMLQIFAARASAELERIQALETLENERASLAQHVEERTLELATANAELNRAARLKNEFLANMSHELRTPLNAILGMSEVLQEGIYGSINEQQNKSLRIIENSGHHLLSLINDVLDLAKIEAGKIKLEIIPISVKKITNTCLRRITELSIKKRIKVSTTFDIAVTIIKADERYLKQMLLNLLNNAIKFTPEEGAVHLEVYGNVEEGMAEFIVSDTGIGIPEIDMKYLFKPFVQLDAGLNRAHEGAGLGLSLVYRLAEMHGGSISVRSEIGKGSHFIISLPWQQMIMDKVYPSGEAKLHNTDIQFELAKEMLHTDKTKLHNTKIQFELAKKTLHTSAMVLLVDDNHTVIETLFNYLKSQGYQVVIAYDGVQAINKAMEIHPALILMDIQMPNMDGLEAIRRLRADTEMAKIPIIALTALTIPGDREHCLEIGANDYLSKPVSFKGLITAIEKLL
ncbi:PAS domain S-box protein [Candidatus Parabeggiatoa sp. HSG14]|uniref:PAS domain S-box protein n=1 Tax=Candidatus Parabeggiatoa sp. HSG14 TaxID=3055593 RepID=UPI0025A91758|nr:PAS domain S-box protein [Thiotrichales bacterium HSG14]